MIKSNKEVTLETRDTYFRYRNPQILKIAKKGFSKIIFKEVIENFLFSR